jgi:hypothetical protein
MAQRLQYCCTEYEEKQNILLGRRAEKFAKYKERVHVGKLFH